MPKIAIIYTTDITFNATTVAVPAVILGLVSNSIAIFTNKKPGADAENICEAKANVIFIVSSVSRKCCHKYTSIEIIPVALPINIAGRAFQVV